MPLNEMQRKMAQTESSDSAKAAPAVAFEEIEHTADRALRIYGSDLRELLINAARGMNTLMASRLTAPDGPEERSFVLDAADAESLLVEWLSELAFWAETEALVFHTFDLREVSPTHLEASVSGCRVPELDKHIKAVTYHNLAIVRTDKGLTATVVFDV